MSYSLLSIEEKTHQYSTYFTLGYSLASRVFLTQGPSLHLHSYIRQKQFIGILSKLIALIFHSFNIFIQFSCPLLTTYIMLFLSALLKIKVIEKVLFLSGISGSLWEAIFDSCKFSNFPI